MISNLYAVKDKLVGFGCPMILQSDELAKRTFTNFAKKNPNRADLELWRIGAYDEDTADIMQSEKIKILDGEGFGYGNDNEI